MAMPAFAGTWRQEGSDWKYYSENGETVGSAWIEESGSWYYLNAAGSMMTGWVKVDGSWYFLHDNGVMAYDTWIDNCYVNSSGKWVKSR